MMTNSSPPPLKMALDMIKRLGHELAPSATPEQRRDFARLERLINEAQRAHQEQLVLTRQRAEAQAQAAAQALPPRRKSVWSRISSML
jgi:hypothetical protein